MRIVLVMANVQGQAQYDNLSILLQLVALSCVASGGAA